MSEQTAPSPIARNADEGGLKAPPGLGAWGKAWWWFRFAILVKLARLRFIAILAALGLLIVKWDTLVAHYEKWTRPSGADDHAAHSDYEYYCSMHPNFVTDNPKEKCPICFMNTTRRKKGEGAEQEPYPPGVVTRHHLTPYKVAAANIRTWEVGYEPLAKKIETVGTVEFDEGKLHLVSARVKGRIDKLHVKVTGQSVHIGDKLADIYSPELVTTVQNLLDTQGERDKELVRARLRLWGVDDAQLREIEKSNKPITHVTIRSPAEGHVRKKYKVEGEYVEESAPLFDVANLSTVWIEAQIYENDQAFLRTGLDVRATTEALPDKQFQGKLSFVYPHLDQGSRTLRARFTIDNPEHDRQPEASLRPGMYAKVRIDVPATQLTEHFLSRDGRVLAIPEDAVVHTGSQKLVFLQEEPMTFAAVRVELGPLIVGAEDAAFYPVFRTAHDNQVNATASLVGQQQPFTLAACSSYSLTVPRGIQAGDRVVTTGSYLLDAETRVSSAAGSIYYGGTGAGNRSSSSAVTDVRPTTPENLDLKVKASFARLSTPDRKLAEAQQYCPIQKSKLGSMGPLVKVFLKGQPIFLCCKGCEEEALENPDRTLEILARLQKSRGVPQVEKSDPEKESRIKAGLDLLGQEDRRQAEVQKYCPIQNKRLGSMGKPVKLVLKDRVVFLCCAVCEDSAKEAPDRTLATVEKLKVRAKSESSGK